MIETAHATTDQPDTWIPGVNTRVLCLGNDIMGDDSLGSKVAERLRHFASNDVEICSTSEAGFHLLDYVLDARRVLVVDTIQTGAAPPGTIHEFRDTDIRSFPGGSPHYVGLLDSLAVARYLRLPAANEVIILAVETSGGLRVGETLTPALSAVVSTVVSTVRDRIESGLRTSARRKRKSQRRH